tara:strand:- start:867 stop:1406 length:540 start_codon:yes stop_codon:yes gene_type:complete
MAWEKLIESFGALYEKRGQAMLLRTPPPMRVIRPMGAGKYVCVMTGDGPPDYMMLFAIDGTHPEPVLAEAKSNQSGRWQLSNLKEHQAKKLGAWHRSGGLACVLVGHQPTKTGYILPWSKLGIVWEQWKLRSIANKKAPSGTASLSAANMEQMGVSWSFSNGYLEAMHAVIQAHRLGRS